MVKPVKGFPERDKSRWIDEVLVISINPNQQYSAIDYIHRNGASALI